jgi:predicted P-loop ATPase
MTKKLPAPFKREEPKQKDLFDKRGNIHKAVDFLNEHYIIHIPAYDPAKLTIECRDTGRYSEAPTFDDIYLHFVEECETSISETILRKIIRSRNYIKPFDPIKTYIESLRGKYAGKSHIDLLCSFLKCREFDPEKPTYSQERANLIIRKWMVSTIAQWLDNIPNATMLLFIQAKEGFGKTSLCNYFVPDLLKDYSTIASKNESRFDLEDAYTRHPFIIHDELVGINKGSIETWKTIMTTSELNTRRRGEEFSVKRKRIATVLGTSNRNQEKGGFLGENFTYRRFGCIELEDIYWKEYIQVVNVDQMWAEALMLYESSGFQWKFDREDFDEFETYNSKYTIETDAIRYAHLYLAHPSGDDGQWMNATEIVNDMRKNRLIRGEHLTSVNPRTIGIALTSLGYECKKTRNGSLIPLQRYYVKRTYINSI